MTPRPLAKLPSLVILAAVVVALGVLLFAPVPLAPRSVAGMALFDALHFPLFALLTAVCFALFGGSFSRHSGKCLWLAVLAASVLGVASELAQSLFQRTSSWRDFAFDQLGIAIAAATIYLMWQRSTGTFKRTAWLVGLAYLAALVMVALPVWRAIDAGRHQASAFPVLGDFESPWESHFWHAQGNSDTRPVVAERARSNRASQGNHELLVDAHAASWAGVHLLFSSRLPWTGRQALHFDIFNPGDGFELGVRVDGFGGERYNAAIQIEPGANSYRLAFEELANQGTRLADPSRFEAKQLTLHLGKSRATRTFYLDNVRLE